MELFKVMVVDDEILAIEDIQNLINWENNGFQIVATTSSSQEALKLFQVYQPDVVFLDIKMPVISGLDLSSRFLEINDKIKIILITAYKDFKYAKRAVELGVSNYLVKHEINKDSLGTELKRVKNEISNQQKMTKIITNQFLMGILMNEDIGQWPLESTVNFYFNSNNEYALILIKEDKPYLWNYFSDEEIQLSQYIMLEKIVHPKHLSSIDLIDYQNQLVVLVSFKDIKSWQEKKDLLYKVSISILNNLKEEKPGARFSTVISRTFYNIKDMRHIFNKIEFIMNNSIFYNKPLFNYQSDFVEDNKEKKLKLIH